MNKKKFWSLLLAPAVLGLFLQSCTNPKSNQEGTSQTDTNKEAVSQNSEAAQQQSSPEATQNESPTDLTKTQSSPEVVQQSSPSELANQPSGTPPTKQQSKTGLTKQQNSTKPSGSSTVLTASNLQVEPSRYADAANFLAGITVDATSPLAKSEKEKSWESHASFFNYAWNKLEHQQLSKVRKWSSTELGSLNQSSGTIFYPFSGPDFLYVYSFFPKASEYVLVGLEPVGEIPNLEKTAKPSEIGTNLRWLESSMADVMQLSFFKTKNMAKDFKDSKLKGVLPILFVFLARTNNTIQDVHYLDLNKDGTLQVLDSGTKSTKKVPSGVKIDFIPAGESTPRSLYYFSTDLSNEGLKKAPEFEAYVKSLSSPTTYLKAASYLMYQDGFSNIRNLILSQSSSLLQDDSGMPVKYFDRSKWNLKFYGSYTGPIGLFKARYQADLRKVYATDKTIKPLDFGIGYQYRVNQSNLMLATPK